MQINFYGKRLAPPSDACMRVFALDEKPALLHSGQRTTYVSGGVVLKPAEGNEEWTAELFDMLPESSEIRFPRPVRALSGEWSCEGYVAWTFLDGGHASGAYEQKIRASRAYHSLLANIEKPAFLDREENSWAVAHTVALGFKPFNYETGFMDLYEQIQPHLLPLDIPTQIIHGDLSGNFLIHVNLPPAIIDFSPAWGPVGFAEGIMLADAAAWENADAQALDTFKTVPHIEQLAWRGIIRRIAEQAEHMRFFNKDKEQALNAAREFQKSIDVIGKLF